MHFTGTPMAAQTQLGKACVPVHAVQDHGRIGEHGILSGAGSTIGAVIIRMGFWGP